MFLSRYLRIAAAAAIFSVTCIPAYADSASNVKEILAWDQKLQDSYFQISITMAAYIAAQMDKKQAQCLIDWYPNNPAIITQRNDEIRKRMAGALEFHPSAALLAILQKECGPFAK